MLDFIKICEEETKRSTRVYPNFVVTGASRDLMIKGRSFYAVWDDELNLWRNDESAIQELVDKMVLERVNDLAGDRNVTCSLLADFSSNKWNEWQKYSKAIPDKYRELDSKILFSNDKVKKSDYATRTLSYPLMEMETPAYNELTQVLYSPEELLKLEWGIGAVVSGESSNLQKFFVLYGGPGTGKSTILNIISDMFEGYVGMFESKALASNSQFGLESLRDNPLIGIEHDGDLSKIESNARLNSIISHETMTINEKYKASYRIKFRSLLFIGTNKPVKITDSKSGLLRRLIDVNPTGDTISKDRYDYLMEKIRFEYSGIAHHCLQVYKKLGSKYYNNYIPEAMMWNTNDFYNFVEDNLDLFLHIDEDGLPLSVAWKRYKDYCDDANVLYKMPMRIFREELKDYFCEYQDRYKHKTSVYFGFKRDRFKYKPMNPKPPEFESWLKFDCEESEFDLEFADQPAQYAREEGTPSFTWEKCRKKLRDIDTRRLHYMLVPESLICIDFDLKNDEGEKDYKKNLEAASKFPPTYAELSKSGAGIHLLYWYRGDYNLLSRVFDEGIEIKVFTGKSSLRRMLTKCNDLPIAEISSGLPLKEIKKVIRDETIQSERGLRELIKKNLRKEIHPATKPSVDFILKILDDAYDSGLKYDVRDMRPSIQNFAMNSTNQADYCLRLVSKMKFASEEPSEDFGGYGEEAPIVFFDVEVFPNLFIVVWKEQGEGKQYVKMINPKAEDIEAMTKFRLVGFNNRKYDNHMLYACMMGYTPEQLYKLSQRIITDDDKDAFFGEAYNLSYTDIYDFLSSNNKMSLKKWEIKLGIHHQELGFRWDEPVPEDKWAEVADYCTNDVFATEAVWDANQADWEAREILSEWAELTPNDTTNNCTTRLIVGKDSHPQNKFVYTDLSTIFPGYEYDQYGIDKSRYNEGVKIVQGKSIYKGKDPGEGGYAIGYPGMYADVAVLDAASMHPHSAITLNLFGDEYTMNFKNIVDARIFIKHKDYESAKRIIPERLHKYLENPKKAKKLANALKTAINSVYGLTSARFPNKLKDPRNIDNIVAKYGALFMINLEEEVTNMGYTVVHIKTDSIKIANADNRIIEFVKEYGRKYGYEFEHESTYRKICLVNDAVYIAKYADAEYCNLRYGYVPAENAEHSNEWTATGAQFQIPYVFKTLFSKESIDFADLCETKSVSTAMYLDFNERDGENHNYQFVGKVGLFCPVVDGVGGGLLMRQDGKDPNKFGAVNGTKRPKGTPYRWMESEMVMALGLKDSIDRSYYDKLVDDAVDTISKYGDFERFASDDDYSWLNVSEEIEEGIPFDEFDECINPPVAA